MFRNCALKFGDDLQSINWRLSITNYNDELNTNDLELDVIINKILVNDIKNLIKDHMENVPLYEFLNGSSQIAKKITDIIWLLHFYKIINALPGIRNCFPLLFLGNPMPLEPYIFKDEIQNIKKELGVRIPEYIDLLHYLATKLEKLV